MRHWLFKTEPSEFSIDDLEKVDSELWEGIRNYQARNLMRDEVKLGDAVFIYHSSCKNVGVAGIAEVVKEAYPDPFQFNPESKYFDPKSTQDNPRWVCVDVAFKSRLKDILPLSEMRQEPRLEEMVLLNRSRLSIQPVRADEWDVILEMAATQNLL
ncbi:EVE domain-containing protein [Marinicella sp. W31]|uniref:EVE domain-containing protein n=1 Tax=Marinicella sp. W31 TaxID=3023713 RepID=UPI003757CF15